MNKNVIKPYNDDKFQEYVGKVGGKRNLREIVITTNDDYEFHYLVKKPSRSVLQAIAEYEKTKQTSKIENLLIGCVLEGDKEAFEHDGAMYLELMKQIGLLIMDIKSEIKKN